MGTISFSSRVVKLSSILIVLGFAPGAFGAWGDPITHRAAGIPGVAGQNFGLAAGGNPPNPQAVMVHAGPPARFVHVSTGGAGGVGWDYGILYDLAGIGGVGGIAPITIETKDVEFVGRPGVLPAGVVYGVWVTPGFPVAVLGTAGTFPTPPADDVDLTGWGFDFSITLGGAVPAGSGVLLTFDDPAGAAPPPANALILPVAPAGGRDTFELNYLGSYQITPEPGTLSLLALAGLLLTRRRR